MNTLEVEVNNLKDLVDRMSEGLREEFATIKFEFDNAISDGKKDVDKRLTVLKDDFDKEVLTLKAELRASNEAKEWKFEACNVRIYSCYCFGFH
ncbi:hypothetical protein QL285_058831 [Trifolium repens]|jgi:hypothetical protein|nr:hypothetical protein QL285_058831 [Trifolium repens]